MVKSKTEICNICHKEIYLDKDNYVQLIDYFQGQKHTEGYYHNQCYLEKMKGGSDMKNMAMSLVARTNKLLDKVDGEEKPEYIIR